MNFLHTEFWGGVESTAVVSVDAQCNVLLLSDLDFVAYQHGRSFRYYGGWFTRSPIRLTPPRHGRWHVVVDLGGRAGTVTATTHVVAK